MILRATTFCICLALTLTGCYTDDAFEANNGAFYKLYGNGTAQEAVALEISEAGDIYIVGNQQVRNQDSAAFVLIRANAEGNQLWSRKYYGKGHSTAKCLLLLPNQELLVLAAARPADEAASIPVIYHINQEGDLLSEFFLEQDEGSLNTLNSIPEDMVLGENETLFLVGNRRGRDDVLQSSFITKIAISSGEVFDTRTFSSNRIEAKRILRNGNRLLVIGDTWQEEEDKANKNMFLATFSANLIEAGQRIEGSAGDDSFKRTMVSSGNELIVLSSEQPPGSTESIGVVRFINFNTLNLREAATLNFAQNETPEAIEEDENGGLYVAVNAVSVNGSSNILINKLNGSGAAMWDNPKEIGGEGNDKVAQLKIKNGYVFLLKTIDMQNENTLISLSKVRF